MTVSHDVQVKNTVKKSRFYSSVKEMGKEEEIKEFLKELKNNFRMPVIIAGLIKLVLMSSKQSNIPMPVNRLIPPDHLFCRLSSMKD